jgi:hypothetical protein
MGKILFSAANAAGLACDDAVTQVIAVTCDNSVNKVITVTNVIYENVSRIALQHKNSEIYRRSHRESAVGGSRQTRRKARRHGNLDP